MAAQKDKSRCLPEVDVQRFIKQLAEGIQYMQERGIMHRDLKLSNILITESTPRILKIIDFGLAI